MFRKIRRYLLKLTLALAVFIVSMLVGKHYHSTYFYTTMFLCPVSVLYMIAMLLGLLNELAFFHRLFRRFKRRLRPFLDRMKALAGAISDRVSGWMHTTAFYHKFEFLKLKNTSRITGYTDVHMRSRDIDGEEEYDLYLRRWRRCATNAERVRFLYGKYITKKRRQKKTFSYASTPQELNACWGTTAYSGQLIPAYYEARYNRNAEIRRELVEQLLKAESDDSAEADLSQPKPQ